MATEAELTDEDIEFIKELREAREEGYISRREALGALAGLGIGAGASYSAVGGAKADASTTDSDGNVGTPSDPVDVFAEGLDANSVTTDEAHIGTGTSKRSVVTDADVTLNVPADYGSIQAALNDIPVVRQHNYKITIDDGTYNENIIIPPSLHGASEETGNNGTLVIEGNPATPSNVKVDSLYVTGNVGLRAINIDGIEVQQDNPYDNEDVAIACYGASLYLENIKFADTGNITDGILSYGAHGVVRTEDNVDLGANHVANDGVVVKQSGRYEEQKAPPSGTAISGNVGDMAYQVQSGEAYIDTGASTLTGDSRLVQVEAGRLYDYHTGSAYGVKGLQHPFRDSNKVRIKEHNLGAGSTAQLLDEANPEGAIVTVADHSLGSAAIFHLEESTGVGKIGGSSDFSETQDNADTTNIYWTGSQFEIQNNTGSTRPYGVVRLS